MPHRNIELTERERAIAEKAAEMAVERVIERFYTEVGMWTVKRLMMFVGIAAVSVLGTFFGLKLVGKV
jgi:hypothetical protein